MDATRTAIRLGASAVTCVYRRRVTDMTALAEEIEEAQSEGCQILSLQAPDHIETDETGRVTALWSTSAGSSVPTQGRSSASLRCRAAAAPHTVRCRYRSHRPVHRRKAVRADRSGRARQDSGRIRRICAEHPACIRGAAMPLPGPATVIRAVAAGKVAAANIDAHLGFRHVIKSDVEDSRHRI